MFLLGNLELYVPKKLNVKFFVLEDLCPFLRLQGKSKFIPATYRLSTHCRSGKCYLLPQAAVGPYEE